MSRALLYAANMTDQATVAAGTVLNVGSVVRRYGNNIGISGGNITVMGVGYYNLDVMVNLEGGAAGTAVVTIYKNGVAIPGASAQRTVAADTIYNLTIPTTIREVCCCQDVITIEVSGVATTVLDVTVRVDKE